MKSNFDIMYQKSDHFKEHKEIYKESIERLYSEGYHFDLKNQNKMLIAASKFVRNVTIEILQYKWANEISTASLLIEPEDSIDFYLYERKKLKFSEISELPDEKKIFILKKEINEEALHLFDSGFFDDAISLTFDQGIYIREIREILRLDVSSNKLD